MSNFLREVLFHLRTPFWTPSERPRSTSCVVFSPWKPLASLTALTASPWVGLGRRCPQWMYRWSDINSGPPKCSMLSGYTGKVGWLWYLDLMPACVDALFVVVVFAESWTMSQRIGRFRVVFCLLIKRSLLFGRSSILTVSQCTGIMRIFSRNCCQGTRQFRKHMPLQATSGEDASMRMLRWGCFVFQLLYLNF